MLQVGAVAASLSTKPRNKQPQEEVQLQGDAASRGNEQPPPGILPIPCKEPAGSRQGWSTSRALQGEGTVPRACTAHAERLLCSHVTGPNGSRGTSLGTHQWDSMAEGRGRCARSGDTNYSCLISLCSQNSGN